jgi:uracil-DNA glycosylase
MSYSEAATPSQAETGDQRPITISIYTKESLFKIIPDNWKETGIFNDLAMDNIISELNRDVDNFYPNFEDIFYSLKLIKPQNVKVILLGQDPYPNGEGIGCSFAVDINKTVKLPPSLRNIFKELKTPPFNIHEVWSKEGVLLLNSILTVRKGEPRSHFSIGWEDITSSIIKYLAKASDFKVFLCLGSYALGICKKNLDSSSVSVPHYSVVEAGHPSGLNKSRPFVGSNAFHIVNTELIKGGILPVRWGSPLT